MTKKQASPKKTATFDSAYQEEIDKAFLRIGQTPRKALAWLIRFAQCDLNALSKGEIMDLGYELNCLGDIRFTIGDPRMPFNPAISERDWEGHTREGESGKDIIKQFIATEGYFRPSMNHPSLDLIKNLQKLVAQQIDFIEEDKSLILELPPLSICIYPDMKRDTVRMFTEARNPFELFIHNLAFLLIIGAHRIRRCPECQKIFFADRKNKMSCSARCQNTAAVRRLRQSASDPKSKRGKIPKSSKNPKAKTLKKRGA